MNAGGMNQRERMYHLRSCFEGRRGEGNNLNERVQTDQAGGKTAGIIDGERKEEEKGKRKGGKELFRDKGGFTCLVSEIQH